MLTVVSVVTTCHQSDYDIIDCISYVVRFTPVTSLFYNVKSVLPNLLGLFCSSLHHHLPLVTTGLFSVSQFAFVCSFCLLWFPHINEIIRHLSFAVYRLHS